MQRFHGAALSRILVLSLCALLCPRVEAQSSQSGNLNFTAYKVLIVVSAVVAGGVITALAIHNSSHKKTISGCVSSGPEGMSLANEKDGRVYVLAGETAGISAGDRMTLAVTKIKVPGSGTAWSRLKVLKDSGPCRP